MTIKHRYCAYCGSKMKISPLHYCSSSCKSKAFNYRTKWYLENQAYQNILCREWHANNREYHNFLNWKWRNNSKTRSTWLKCAVTYNKKNPIRTFKYEEYLEAVNNYQIKNTYKCVNCLYTWSRSYSEYKDGTIRYTNKPVKCPNCKTSYWESNYTRVYKVNSTK